MLALPILLVLPWIPWAQPGPCLGCRQMAGRWTPKVISLDEQGEDVLLGAKGKSTWLRTDMIPTLSLLLHPGQLSFCT